MNLRQRVLPSLPKGVAVTALAPNLKLFSDAEISDIKARFTTNGRYRHYVSESGMVQTLRYPIFVFNGKYFASYPGKLFLMGESSFGKIKAAQDLDSGEWVAEKIIKINLDGHDRMSRQNIFHEVDMVTAAQSAMTAKGESVSLQRALTVEKQMEEEKYFGSISELPSDEIFSPNTENDESGKYYFFMKRASGMNLKEWLQHRPHLSAIIKMDISLSLTKALIELHHQGVLHRDIKPANLIFDIFEHILQAVTIVDFGLAIKMNAAVENSIVGRGTSGFLAPEVNPVEGEAKGQYSEKSDIYALGATLNVLWRQSSESQIYPELCELIARMMRKNPSERPDLQTISEEIQQMREQLPANECEINLCILDVDDFRDACENGKIFLDEYIRDLEQYDQIRLFDASHTTELVELLAIKQKLASHHLNVSNEVYVGRHEKMRSFVKEYHNQKIDGRFYRIHFITQYLVLPIAIREEPAAVRPDYIALEMDFEEMQAQAAQDNAAESYDLGSCIAWFFTSLWQDVARFTPTPSNCHRLFSHQAPRLDNRDQQWEYLRKIV